jgi:hypothetical protein
MADASKNKRKINKFTQEKAPIKQISKIKIKFKNNCILICEYQTVNKDIIKINKLKIINGKFKL